VAKRNRAVKSSGLVYEEKGKNRIFDREHKGEKEKTHATAYRGELQLENLHRREGFQSPIVLCWCWFGVNRKMEKGASKKIAMQIDPEPRGGSYRGCQITGPGLNHSPR